MLLPWLSTVLLLILGLILTATAGTTLILLGSRCLCWVVDDLLGSHLRLPQEMLPSRIWSEFLR